MENFEEFFINKCLNRPARTDVPSMYAEDDTEDEYKHPQQSDLRCSRASTIRSTRYVSEGFVQYSQPSLNGTYTDERYIPCLIVLRPTQALAGSPSLFHAWLFLLTSFFEFIHVRMPFFLRLSLLFHFFLKASLLTLFVHARQQEDVIPRDFFNFPFFIFKCMFFLLHKKKSSLHGKDYSMVRWNRLIVISQKVFCYDFILFCTHFKDFIFNIIVVDGYSHAFKRVVKGDKF